MTMTTETPRTDAIQCEAGILSANRCMNPAIFETSTGYKCCEYHTPQITKGKNREDVKPLTTNTPRTDACPHYGADIAYEAAGGRQFMCGSWSFHTKTDRPYKCRYYEVQIRAERAEAEVEKIKQERNRIGVEIRGEYLPKLKDLQAEVERLTGKMKKAEDLIKGLHDGWKKARKAHLETCKNAQREIDKLHAENVCLQELIQEFYEWSRRDFPTEQEVREIMNRYHDLLNK